MEILLENALYFQPQQMSEASKLLTTTTGLYEMFEEGMPQVIGGGICWTIWHAEAGNQ